MDEEPNLFKPAAMPRADVLHEQQLLRDLGIINARAIHMFGPPTVNASQAVFKRKPNLPDRAIPPSMQVSHEHEESETMNLRQIAATASLTIAGALAACGADGALPSDRNTDSHVDAHPSKPESENAGLPDVGGHKNNEKLSIGEISKSCKIYQNRPIGNEQACKAGAKTDEDGMYQVPIVSLSRKNEEPAWTISLDIPSDMYQGRATHCVASSDAIYVLVQWDTQSQQESSQTLLEIIKLDRKNGSTLSAKNIDVPNMSNAYTAWVDKGSENFDFINNKIGINGKYRLMSKKEDVANFSMEVNEF